MAELVRSEMQDLGYDVSVDAAGNVVGRLDPDPNPKALGRAGASCSTLI